MNANEIKTKLIDYLIAENADAIIGNEVAFGFNKSMADIVQLLNGKIYALEIKGDRDDFRKLPKQIDFYEKVFDYLYVVTTIKHIAECHKLDKKTGIILVSPKEDITVIRKAKLQPKNDKGEILETINSRFLKSHFGIVGNKTSAEIRHILRKKSKKTVKNTLHGYFRSLIEPKFKIFLSEKGIQTHIEDVSLLSLHNRIITE